MKREVFCGKKVVVTGGSGFIGSHIVDQLLKIGAKVTVVDDLSTGRLANLENVVDGVHFIGADILDKPTCVAAATDAFAIFHLAAIASVRKCEEEPGRCLDVNLQGTWNMLEAARVNGVSRFIFSSSAAVYGAKSGLCRETDDCDPISSYGFSKLMAERVCRHYSRFYGVGTLCLRYFNVFGSRQNPDGEYAAVVAKFSDRMRSNLPITVYGDGSQTRDFISVSEVASANLTMAQLPYKLMDGSPVNIASGTSVSLLQLINQLKKQFPKYSANLTFVPARSDDIQRSEADCSRYRRLRERVL